MATFVRTSVATCTFSAEFSTLYTVINHLMCAVNLNFVQAVGNFCCNYHPFIEKVNRRRDTAISVICQFVVDTKQGRKPQMTHDT